MPVVWRTSRLIAIIFAVLAGGSSLPLLAQVEKPIFKVGLVPGELENPKLKADVMTAASEAFVRSRRFEMVERQHLNAVLTEKDLQEFLGGQVNQKLSDVLGLDFIGIVGSLTDKVEGVDGKPQSRFILNVRMIDVRTAKVVATLESVRGGLLQPTNAREAGQSLFHTIRESFPPVGYVIQVDGKDIAIDLGAEAGLKEGDLLEVVREGDRLIHPVYGTEMPAIMKVIGELKVSSIHPAMATCRTKGGNFKVAPGNVVRLKAKDSKWLEMFEKVPLIEKLHDRIKNFKKDH